MVKTRVIILQQHAINQQLRLFSEPNKTRPVRTLVKLYQEIISLCNNLINNSISVKHFTDHLKIINLGLETNIFMIYMENENTVLEE